MQHLQRSTSLKKNVIPRKLRHKVAIFRLSSTNVANQSHVTTNDVTDSDCSDHFYARLPNSSGGCDETVASPSKVLEHHRQRRQKRVHFSAVERNLKVKSLKEEDHRAALTKIDSNTFPSSLHPACSRICLFLRHITRLYREPQFHLSSSSRVLLLLVIFMNNRNNSAIGPLHRFDKKKKTIINSTIDMYKKNH